mgnify:CR=1 FL=1
MLQINTVNKINSFYKSRLKKKPKIAVLGLNPHCETIDNYSEEDKIILPSIKNWFFSCLDFDLSLKEASSFTKWF